MSDFSPPAADPNAAAAPGFGPAPQEAAGFAGTVPAPPPAPGFGPPAPGYAAPAPSAASPGGGYGYPVPNAAQPADPGQPGKGILAGLGVMVVSAGIYAAIIDATKYEITYMALAIGLLVGLAVGKVGGRNPLLPAAAVVMALLGIFLGEFIGLALVAGRMADISATNLLLSHTGLVFDGWKQDLNAKSALFYGIGGIEAFVFTRRASGATVPRARGRRR